MVVVGFGMELNPSALKVAKMKTLDNGLLSIQLPSTPAYPFYRPKKA